ncbi:hypothetical protein [Enterococcus hermanniensis]|nr:hypothetical protein [Enterococcus hermanniensis]
MSNQFLSELIEIPENYRKVSKTNEKRNNQTVEIRRYQVAGEYTYNGPRIIEVVGSGKLISLKNLTTVPVGRLLTAEKAQILAVQLFAKAHPAYAKGLSFIRIEQQERSFWDVEGKLQTFPVQWVKFAHQNGSYNWVTLGATGVLIELEIDSRWDYFRGRRKTEMWDNDDWVLAREGKGPQLASPNALA